MPTFANSINQALDQTLGSDPNAIFIGEDVCDPYSGAFKVSKGLSTKYPKRVINTPMSEYALTGLACGLSMRGTKTVLEIMFGDFLTICADQIVNHASKFSWMFNGQVSVPMVIRTPMGGRRGYGPTHSQSIEKMFLGIPGLKIIAPSHYHDPGQLLIRAINDKNLILFIENKILYSRELGQIVDGYIGNYAVQRSNDYYETITLSNADFKAEDVTILTYGGMLPTVLESLNKMLVEEEITAQVVVPSYINRFSLDEIAKSIKQTGRLLIVEEGTLFSGWGAEMIAQTVEKFSGYLKAAPRRVAAKDVPIANTKVLEDFTLPQEEDIVIKIREIMK